MHETRVRRVIGLSSVILAGAAGDDALIAAELDVFPVTLGFSFIAHWVATPASQERINRAALCGRSRIFGLNPR